ncbi:hypothetical protein [Paenibacillus sp. 22594]|uniref:hypothetical protein n=1 Tax=Paenibacillus sp. 22594 TaxID=3453947 RepID=UPI003F83E17B
MELSEIIDFMSHSSSDWSSRGHEVIKIPFDVTPNEYLTFAELDIDLNKEKHSLINALSNAKRAIDCQIDSLLVAFQLYDLAKKKNWNIPKKIEIIKSLGILAPRILNKINSVRNIVEHEFMVPDEEQVVDFVDIVALFLVSTERYIINFPDESQIENGNYEHIFLDIKFNRGNENIVIEVRYRGKIKDTEQIILNTFHEDYIRFLALYLRMLHN